MSEMKWKIKFSILSTAEMENYFFFILEKNVGKCCHGDLGYLFFPVNPPKSMQLNIYFKCVSFLTVL